MSAFTDRVDALGATYHNRLSGAVTLSPRVGTGNFAAGAGATLGATGGGADGEDCVSFDGSSSGNYIDIQSPADGVSYHDRIKDTFSLFFAFNLDTNAKDQILWQMGGKDRGVFITVDGSTENLGVLFWDFNTAYEITTAAPSTGSWHTLALVSDTGVPDEVEMFIDGASVGTVDVSGMGNEKISPEMVVMGDAAGSNGSGNADARLAGDSSTRISGGSGEVDGALADFAFFSDVVLTSTNASDLHSDWAGSGGGTTYDDAVSEGAGAGDTFANNLTAQGALSEGSQAGDTLAAIGSFLHSITQGAVAGETLSSIVNSLEEMSEGSEAGDSFASLIAVLDNMSEGAEAGDTFGSLIALISTLSEGSQAGDAFASVMTMLASMSEGAEAGSTMAAILTALSSISEGSLAGDSFGGGITTDGTLSEGALAGDSMSSLIALIDALSEGAVAGDVFESTVEQAISALSEGATAGETFAATLLYLATITEGAAASDSFQVPTGGVHATGTASIFALATGGASAYSHTATISINP